MSNIDDYLSKRSTEREQFTTEAARRTSIAQQVLDEYIEIHVKKSTHLKNQGFVYAVISDVHTLSRASKTISLSASSRGIHLSAAKDTYDITTTSADDKSRKSAHFEMTKWIFDRLLPKEIF